ncbi:MAG: glycosyltransferase family 2 protein [Bacteroidetes bacterium]|nr:MAG: glycosyltransferase family 2 protein [Bacteroidota bacterium]
MPPLHEHIHLLIPAYNESEVIAETIAEIRQALPACHIVIIDDGSTDDTAAKAKAAGAEVLRHPINRGAGAAVQTAISLARCKGWRYIAFMDADGQHVPADLTKMWHKMQQSGADLVIGSRFLEPNPAIPRSRRIFNSLANMLTNTFCRNRYSDTQSGFRLLNRRAIEQIDLFQDDFSFCSEMLIQAENANLTIVETPIHVRYTEYSVSKGQDLQVGFWTAFHFLWKAIFK